VAPALIEGAKAEERLVLQPHALSVVQAEHSTEELLQRLRAVLIIAHALVLLREARQILAVRSLGDHRDERVRWSADRTRQG
jgi:hypothetical protein